VAADGLLVRSRYSLRVQSRASRFKITGPFNEDGYGVGWFNDDPAPRTFVGTEPAWDSTELQRVTPAIRSGCWFGHVRAASPGMEASCENAHPFSRRGILWMHNGLVADFWRMRERMLQYMDETEREAIRGNTDSEVCFALFLSLLPRYDGNPVRTMRKLFDLIPQWQHDLAVGGPSYLNFAATNGNWMVLSRYVTERDIPSVSLFIAEDVYYDETGASIHLMNDGDGGTCVIVASEPLTEDTCWKEIPPQTLLSIEPSLEIERIAL
jgi:predicted glutamine amidotransferase